MEVRTLNFQEIQIKKINTLVFEGCGSRFFTYMFALDALQKHTPLHQIQRVAASSSGAIVATLLSIGFAPSEMIHIFESMQFFEFLDPSKTSRYIPVLGPFASMISHRGAYLGEKCANFFKKNLENQGLDGNITFQELHEFKEKNKLLLPDLYLTAANVTRQGQLQIFSYETTPYVPIVDALIAAIAYPGCIQPRSILMKSKMEQFIDGGVRDNFPFNIFPMQEWPFILGLKVDTKGEIFGHAYAEPSLSEFLYELVHDGEYEFKKYHKKRTIQFYDCNLGVLQTSHSLLEKFALKISGEKAVRDFFEEGKKSDEKYNSSQPIDNQAQRARTAEFIAQLKKQSYNELAKKIHEWKDDQQGAYIYYHVILDVLKKRSSLYHQFEYKNILELVKSRSIKTSFFASSTADHIFDVLMTYLKDGQGDLAYQYLIDLKTHPFHLQKLLDINHDVILDFLSKNRCCSVKFKNKDQLIELIESFKEQKLKTHPGAAEAEYVLKVDAALKRRDYDKAENLLQDANSYLNKEETKELYVTVQLQLKLQKNYLNSSFDNFLEKALRELYLPKNTSGFFQAKESVGHATVMPTKVGIHSN